MSFLPLILFLVTIAFAGITFALIPSKTDRYHKTSLVVSFYGIVAFLIIRSFLFSNINYDGEEFDKLLIQGSMIKSGLTVVTTSLLIGISLNVVQLRHTRTPLYIATLMTQIILLVIAFYAIHLMTPLFWL